MLCNIRNKNSVLYSELLFAINKFNSGRCDYIPSNNASKKILRGAGIMHCGYFKRAIYADKFDCDTYEEDILLNLKSGHMSIINVDY